MPAPVDQRKTETKEPARQILLVDDDMMMLGLLSECLVYAGYDTRLASSAKMAIDMISEMGRKPDLAILDVTMPGMSGLDLARVLRADTGIPFMFLSASDDNEVIRQASEYGAVGYLVKPISHTSITPAVQAALARADEIDQLRQNELRLTTAVQTGRETGMALGVLMERYKIDSNTAFEILREHARSNRRKLNDVAHELLHAQDVMNSLAVRVAATLQRKSNS
jgi:response regulator NasT